MDNRHACRLSMSINYVISGKIEPEPLLTPHYEQALRDEILKIAETHALRSTCRRAIFWGCKATALANKLQTNQLTWVQISGLLDWHAIAEGDDKVEMLGKLRLGQAHLAHLADHKADARAYALHVAWDVAEKTSEYLIAWHGGHTHRDEILQRDAWQQPAGAAHLHSIGIHEHTHSLAAAAVVPMHHGVDHGLPQRFVRIFGLIFTIKPTNGRANPDVLLQEAAGLIDQLGKSAQKVLAVDVAAHAERIG